MNFKEVPAQSFIQYAMCDCGEELIQTDRTIALSNPPLIEYKCPACGTAEMLNDFYPKVVSREMEETK